MDFEKQCGWASSNLLKNVVKKRVTFHEQERILLRLKLQLFSESLPLLYVPRLSHLADEGNEVPINDVICLRLHG